MRKLLISIVSVVVVIGLVLIITPLLLGITVQKEYPQIINRFVTNPDVKLELVNYQRGWFSSRAELKVTLYGALLNPQGSLPLDQKQVGQFTINQTIHHGPILFATLNDGAHKLYFGLAIAENAVNQENLQIKTFSVWTFRNHVKTLISSPKLQIENPQQRLILQGVNANIEYILHANQIKINAAFGDVEFWGKTASSKFEKMLQITNLVTKIDTQLDASNMWYGKTNLTTDKVMLYPTNEGITTLNKAQLEINQKLQDNKQTAITVTSLVDEISNNETDLKQFNLRLFLENLDTAALGNFNQAMQQNKPAYAAMFDLVSKGFSLDLQQLGFTTEDGPVDLHARIKFPAQIQQTANPLYWFEAYKKLLGHAQLQLPQQWLNKWLITYYQKKIKMAPDLQLNPQLAAQEQVNYWLQNDIIQKQAANFTLMIDIKDGKLLVNGNKPKVKQFFMDEQQLSNQQADSKGNQLKPESSTTHKT